MIKTWRDFLTPEESQALVELKAAEKTAMQERRKIYARCRKRMERAKEKAQ